MGGVLVKINNQIMKIFRSKDTPLVPQKKSKYEEYGEEGKSWKMRERTYFRT